MKNSFNPDEIIVLAKVVDEACLKVPCADEKAKELLALRVLDRAAQGERDYKTLLTFALNGRALSDAA
jgi:hypothetical protein